MTEAPLWDDTSTLIGMHLVDYPWLNHAFIKTGFVDENTTFKIFPSFEHLLLSFFKKISSVFLFSITSWTLVKEDMHNFSENSKEYIDPL